MKKILILILVIGGFFRFYGVNWDSYQAFHPDERNISWAVTRVKFPNQLNPKFFAYGGLPIYLYRALGEAVVALTKNPVWLTDWGHIAVIGRSVSAILSTISIALIFFVGAAYFSPSVGIISAFLLAFSPWAIREAHFATTETMLVFFLLLLLLLSRKISNFKFQILNLGIVWGLAMAAKTTSLLFGVIPLVALGKKINKSFFVTCIAGIVFFSLSPYTVLDFSHFQESMTYETGVALGRFSVPYTLQFLHTTPYLYQIVTMLWQAGPLVIVGLTGLILLIKKKNAVFLVFPLIYFAWNGMWYAKFSRYNVPFLPFITITAAWLSIKIGKKFTIILLIATSLWGLANFTVYIRPQTRITASEWIYNNVSPTAMLFTEHWNDGLPINLPQYDTRYKRELINAYDEPDDAKKKLYLINMLTRGDYIIFSTRRIWATMPDLKTKYPITSRFYEQLLAGNLGYKEVATFTSRPELFGLTINDDSAEESVQVFDHPTVRIFQHTEKLSREELLKRLEK